MKHKRQAFFCLLILVYVLILLPACQPAMQPATPSPAPSVSTPIAEPTQVSPTREPVVEAMVMDIEWPLRLRWGDSDTVRMRLLPDGEDYILEAEFPEHEIESQSIPVERPDGYALSAFAQLEGVGFTISPQGMVERQLPPGEGAVWHWTFSPERAGQQRLTIQMVLRWIPGAQISGATIERRVLSRGLDVQVTTFLGLTADQSLLFGMFGIIIGGGLSLTGLLWKDKRLRASLLERIPAETLTIETASGIVLQAGDERLLKGLFNRYGRVMIVKEFLSGYSGARTLLVLPVLPGGQSDAYTIVKIGERDSMMAEYHNYETYVKDRLPPITARIQQQPITIPGSDRASLQYTFIAEPGRHPVSLRESLLANNQPELLVKLFDTFGPNWWMQRSPYTFSLAQEYDRLLPPHAILEPVEGGPVGRVRAEIDRKTSPDMVKFNEGDVVYLRGVQASEVRADGNSLTLFCTPQPGQPALRMRWPVRKIPVKQYARIVKTRGTLLGEWTNGMNRYGLNDPLLFLDGILSRLVHGTRSIIHGDLNVENILVGPGGFVWLIDFAHTREGHTLFDFAHLEMELITQVIAQVVKPDEFVDRLSSGTFPILAVMDHLSRQCYFNPEWSEEMLLARVMTCLGGLKYANLSGHARHLLYLAASWWGKKLNG